MEDSLLHSVIEKIVAGNKDWTAEELQYQRNYPNEVEKALHEYRQKAEILDRVSIVHYDCTIFQKHKIAERLGVRPRLLSFPEAVAFAVMVPCPFVGKEANTVILTIVGDTMDLALLTIGDGVYEVRYTQYASPITAEKIYHTWRETQLELEKQKVDRLLIVTIEHQTFRYTVLVEKLFGVKAECMDNLHQLVQRGREICAGIMTGEVKDVLLLSVIPQTIGIEMEEGMMLPLVDANTTIPFRKSKTLFLDAGVPQFRIEVWQGNDCCARKNDLVGVLCMKNQVCQPHKQREMELMVDIDSNGTCLCKLTDKTYDTSTGLQHL